MPDQSDPATHPKRTACFAARGRTFTARQLETIRRIATRYKSEGRTSISVRICRALNWKQKNGGLKDIACREVMRKLAEKRLITLPLPLYGGAAWPQTQTGGSFTGDQTPIDSVAFTSIRLQRISNKNDPNSSLWNQLVSEFHYLRQSRLVGRQIKYTFWLGDRPIACFGWTDAAWAIRTRDEWIGWSPSQLAKSRHRIINNARFLIVP